MEVGGIVVVLGMMLFALLARAILNDSAGINDEVHSCVDICHDLYVTHVLFSSWRRVYFLFFDRIVFGV